MNRDDVLMVARECGFHVDDSGAVNDGIETAADFSAELERFAAAMYAKGAEDMRERAANACKQVDLHSGDHLKHSDPRVTCAEAIRALPTTNTEGEQGCMI